AVKDGAGEASYSPALSFTLSVSCRLPDLSAPGISVLTLLQHHPQIPGEQLTEDRRPQEYLRPRRIPGPERHWKHGAAEWTGGEDPLEVPDHELVDVAERDLFLQVLVCPLLPLFVQVMHGGRVPGRVVNAAARTQDRLLREEDVSPGHRHDREEVGGERV